MPDPNNFDLNHAADGQLKNVKLEVAGTGGLVAPDSYIKVYSKSATPTITIDNISSCSGTFYARSTDANQHIKADVGSTTLTPPSNCPSSITWGIFGSDLAYVGNTQYYVWYIHATNAGALTSFTLRSNDAEFGYVGYEDPGVPGNDKFAIQNKGCSGSGCTAKNATRTANYTIKFATKCGVTSGVKEYLNWFDDDQNGSDNQMSQPSDPVDAQVDDYGTNMTFDIFDETANKFIIQNQRPQKGDDQPGSYEMTFEPNHKYRWQWFNVADSNGIQFQLPYDSFFYNATCNSPPAVSYDAHCDVLNIGVLDAEADKYDVQVLIDDFTKVKETYYGVDSNKVSSFTGISQYKDFSAHKIKLIIFSAGQKFEQPVQDIEGSPCVKPTCAAMTLIPASPESGQSFKLKASFLGAIGSSAPGIGFYGWLESGFTGVSNISPSGPPTYAQAGNVPSGGSTSGLDWNMTAGAAGNVTGQVKFVLGSSPNQTLLCDTTIAISDHPYLRVWRGDVLAGCEESSSQAVWSPDPSSPGNIQAWNNGASSPNPVDQGAGSDLAVQALGNIAGFASAQKSGMTGTNVLSFANSGSNVNTTWGGNFGAGLCPTNYWDPSVVNTLTNLGSVSSMSVSSLSSGSYRYSGGTINGGAIANGKHITLYIDGDATIKNNITFADWTSLGQIPSLTVIAKGDINIGHGVSSLSGTYVAQPDMNNGGTISTCTNDDGSSYSPNGLVNNCRGSNGTLNVYGSFVARTVRLLRLNGTAAQADNSDYAPGSGAAAEKFIYSPDFWLSSSSAVTPSGYDSITSLPPIF